MRQLKRCSDKNECGRMERRCRMSEENTQGIRILMDGEEKYIDSLSALLDAIDEYDTDMELSRLCNLLADLADMEKDDEVLNWMLKRNLEGKELDRILRDLLRSMSELIDIKMSNMDDNARCHEAGKKPKKTLKSRIPFI